MVAFSLTVYSRISVNSQKLNQHMSPEELEEQLRSLIQELRNLSNIPESALPAPSGEETYEPIQTAQQRMNEIRQIKQRIVEMPSSQDDQTKRDRNRLNRNLQNRHSEIRVLISQVRSKFEAAGESCSTAQSYRQIYEDLWQWCVANVDELPVNCAAFSTWFSNKLSRRCEIWGNQQSRLQQIHQILQESDLLWKPNLFKQARYETALRRRFRWFDDRLWQGCPENKSIVSFFNEKLERSYQSVGVDDDLNQIVRQAQSHMLDCRTLVSGICELTGDKPGGENPEALFKFLQRLRKRNLAPDVADLVREASTHAKEYSKLFSKLWEESEKSGKIWRAGFPRTLEEISKMKFTPRRQLEWDSYVTALDKTWDYFCQNLERYNPNEAVFITWFNSTLRWRFKDEVRKNLEAGGCLENEAEVDGDRTDPNEFEDEILDESESGESESEQEQSRLDPDDDLDKDLDAQEALYEKMGRRVRNWANRDETGKLRRTRMHNPHHSAQEIIQEFLSADRLSQFPRNLACPQPILDRIAGRLDIPAATLERFWRRSCAPAILDCLRGMDDLF